MSRPRGPWRVAALAARSAACTALLRARGVAVEGVVGCEGMLPALHTGGTVVLGRGLALRGMTSRVELGAHPGARLAIGARVFLNQGASVVATAGEGGADGSAAGGITLGDDVHVGDLVGISDSDHHPVDRLSAVRTAPVVVGNHAWIGRGATLLPGAVVGEHAVIGAGAVVTGTIPPGVVALGVPARPVRDLDVAPGWRRA